MLTRMPAACSLFTVGAKLAPVRDEIEAALGRDLLTFLRDQADFVGHNAQSDVDNLGRVAHLEVELGHDVRAQPFDIALLTRTHCRNTRGDPWAPVCSQMLAMVIGSGSAFCDSGIEA